MDRSFSGDERHNAFLNVKGKRFTDISAVTGFDFAEDGRALVLDDWDFDGDVDVWVTARTAPRLRLLKNNVEKVGESVFLKLQGNGTATNRDAVGARCELWLEGEEYPLTRAVRAGDSFLSQSSAWLHFGLGSQSQITRVVVHWPAGKEEEFVGVQPGKRFILNQEAKNAQEWMPPTLPPSIVTEVSPELELPAETDLARVVLPGRIPLPMIHSHDGKPLDESDLRGPLVVNLWASWCTPCLTELKEWSEHSEQFRAAGLRVLAANTDELAGHGTTAAAKGILDGFGFPYPSMGVDNGTIQRLDFFQRSFLDRWLPLPVPSSFLVDREGRVAVIYKGPVSAEALIRDLALLDADRETMRKAATPFRGRWAGHPPSIGVSRFVGQLLDHNQLDDAKKFIFRYLASERRAPSASVSPMVGALRYSALFAMLSRDYEAAIVALEEALAIVPEDAEFQGLLAEAKAQIAKQKAGKAQSPLANLLAQVESNPKSGKAHLDLANAYRDLKDYPNALASYKNALRNDPKLFVAAGRLAWILATHPSPEIQEPKAALALSERLMKVTGGKDPNILDLRGVALAASGDFASAAESARAAIHVIEGDTPYKRAITLRLNLYEEGKPYLEGGVK